MELPSVVRRVETRSLLVMRSAVRPLPIAGATPGALRRVGVVAGGRFGGERLFGAVPEGGSGRQSVRAAGSTRLDVRLVLRVPDDAPIGIGHRVAGGPVHGVSGIR